MHFSTQSMFLSNNELYQQIDVVAMRCPLAPTIAIFFIGYMETIIFKIQTSDHPKMCIRMIVLIMHA